MREIKFRIWNGMKMEYDITAGRFGIFYVNPERGDGLNPKDTACLTENTTKYSENTPLMQFIGLTDKNGKEIFEGDRVKYKNIVGLVVYLTEYATFAIRENYERYGYSGYSDTYPIFEESIEVIGNIHENSELLNLSR